MNTKAKVKNVKTAQEIEDDLDMAISLQTAMASNGQYFDFRSYPYTMALIYGDISDAEYAARNEHSLESLSRNREKN